MATNKMERKPSADKIIEAAEQLDSSELDQVVGKLVLLRAQRRAPSLSSQESSLLTRINTVLPADVRERYSKLIAKCRAETLTEEEYAELLRLTDVAELNQAERIQALVELAQLRQVSLDEVMQQLNVER